MDVGEFSYLWTGERADWALIRTSREGAEDLGYGIYNVPRGSALLIEDDEIHAEVVARMLSAGVRILDTVPRREAGPAD